MPFSSSMTRMDGCFCWADSMVASRSCYDCTLAITRKAVSREDLTPRVVIQRQAVADTPNLRSKLHGIENKIAARCE